jgi:S1-C subfamily serine protease
MHVILGLMLLAQGNPVDTNKVDPRSARRSPVVQVVEQAGPAVVNISSEVVENPFSRPDVFEELRRDFFGSRPRQRSESLGSGVIIDAAQGLVLTNEHVISRASAITISLSDRRTFAVDVIGADPEFDLAVLKVRNTKGLPTVKLGTSSDLMPGETVIAIGNPFGLANTVTTGVVSALHRSINAGERNYEDFIQTDAAINPGNSGGALLNIQGELIGINTAVHRGGAGIGFAIPIDKAKAVIAEVLRYGGVRPVFTGVVPGASDYGAVVAKVRPNSPAAKAGLKAGDVITDVGGQEVRGPSSWRHIERSMVPGQVMKVTVERKSKDGPISVPVDVPVEELSPDQARAIGRERLGLDVIARDNQLMINAVDKGSAAAQVGIKRGDLLLGMAGQRLSNTKQFEALVAQLYDIPAVSVGIGRRGRAYIVTLELTE